MYQLIDENQQSEDPLSITRACDYLGVSRTGYYSRKSNQGQNEASDPLEFTLKPLMEKIAF